MPFRSEAQRRYLFKHNPKLARKWAHEYGTPHDLPEHVSGQHRRHELKKRLRSRHV